MVYIINQIFFVLTFKSSLELSKYCPYYTMILEPYDILFNPSDGGIH